MELDRMTKVEPVPSRRNRPGPEGEERNWHKPPPVQVTMWMYQLQTPLPPRKKERKTRTIVTPIFFIFTELLSSFPFSLPLPARVPLSISEVRHVVPIHTINCPKRCRTSSTMHVCSIPATSVTHTQKNIHCSEC